MAWKCMYMYFGDWQCTCTLRRWQLTHKHLLWWHHQMCACSLNTSQYTYFQDATIHLHVLRGRNNACTCTLKTWQYIYYWSLLYSAVLRCWADSLRSHVILHEWIASFFYSAFLNIHRSGVLTTLAWLVPHESAAVLARSVYTIQPCTMSLHAKPHT